MTSCLQRLVIVCLLFSVISSFQWTHTPEDGHVMYTCVGDTVLFPWNYTLSVNEEISNVEWFFSGRSEEIVAFLSHGIFVPSPSFSNRVQQAANGGLVLNHVTKGNAGNFSVEFSIRNTSGAAETRHRHTFVLQVFDHLPTDDGQLHVVQQPEAQWDNSTQQWSLVLSCGHFSFLAQPAFPVHWLTPSGRVLSSNTYKDGVFDLHLASPVEGGSYVCRVPQQYMTSSCVHGNKNGTVEASVVVDDVKVRLTLMEAQLHTLRQENEALRQEKDRDIQSLRQQDEALRQENSALRDQLKSDVHNLTEQIHDVATPRISFNAYSSHDQLLNAPSHVQFNTVLYNQGGGYNPSTGDFTAPVSGTYVFYFHTQSYSSHYAHAYIKANGHVICTAWIANNYDHGSCQAVVHLAANSTVWVEAYSSNEYYWQRTTSFTGFLLSDDAQ